MDLLASYASDAEQDTHGDEVPPPTSVLENHSITVDSGPWGGCRFPTKSQDQESRDDI
jgi:hypothetical protein